MDEIRAEFSRNRYISKGFLNGVSELFLRIFLFLGKMLVRPGPEKKRVEFLQGECFPFDGRLVLCRQNKYQSRKELRIVFIFFSYFSENMTEHAVAGISFKSDAGLQRHVFVQFLIETRL